MGCCTAFERTSGVEVIANVWGERRNGISGRFYSGGAKEERG